MGRPKNSCFGNLASILLYDFRERLTIRNFTLYVVNKTSQRYKSDPEES